MITPIHTGFNLILLFLITKFNLSPITTLAVILLLSAELIDLDHLSSKPIYHPKRNPFKSHVLHKNWKIILVISIILLFFHPFRFLGVGLISHLFLDYIYVKGYKLN